MKEEDRSRKAETLSFSELKSNCFRSKTFLQIWEKTQAFPGIQSSRIGKLSAGSTIDRLVKVATLLKRIEERKTVFISPDCSAEKRGHRKKLN